MANEFQNRDLFWALRGGGGGSWGVVVNVTLRTFPDPPLVFQSLQLVTPNITAFWDFIREFHVKLPAINDAGGSGYYFVQPGTKNQSSTLDIILLFVGQTDEAPVAKLLDPLIFYANHTIGSSSVVAFRAPLPQSKALIQEVLPAESDNEGSIVRVGSRLVSRDFLARPGGAARLTETFQALYAPGGGGGIITGHIVAGGQVASNQALDVAVNPAWRRTVTHLAFGVSWPVDASVVQQRVEERRLTDVMVPLFAKLEPDMGAYLNEADARERNFQTSFWGANYKRLRRIKDKLDPEGIFITNAGVGSEDWGVDGLCRV